MIAPPWHPVASALSAVAAAVRSRRAAPCCDEGASPVAPEDWSVELPVTAAEGRAYAALAVAWNAVVEVIEESPVTMADPERGARPKYDAQRLVAELQVVVRQTAAGRRAYYAAHGAAIPGVAPFLPHA